MKGTGRKSIAKALRVLLSFALACSLVSLPAVAQAGTTDIEVKSELSDEELISDTNAAEDTDEADGASGQEEEEDPDPLDATGQQPEQIQQEIDLLLDEPTLVEYSGGQGSLGLTLSWQGSIQTIEGTTDNCLVESVDPSNDFMFTITTNSSGVNWAVNRYPGGSVESWLDDYVLPYMSIQDDEGATVASSEDGALVFDSCVDDTYPIKYGVTFRVPAGTFEGSHGYTLLIGSKFANPNTGSTLNANVTFAFTTSALSEGSGGSGAGTPGDGDTQYIDYSDYFPYLGSQGAVAGDLGTFTATMTNPLSQGVTAVSGAVTDEVTVVSDPLGQGDGDVPYFHNIILDPYDASSPIVFEFDLYGQGGNTSNVSGDVPYIHVYTSADPSKWGDSTTAWNATTSNASGTGGSANWTNHLVVTIPADSLEAGKSYYFALTRGMPIGHGTLQANIVFEFSTDTTRTGAWSGSETASGAYVGSQGIASKVTLTDPSQIETIFGLSTSYNCWYNVIGGGSKFDAANDVQFAIKVEGGGSKHQTQSTWESGALPYIKVYKNIGYNEAINGNSASLSFADSDLVASWDSGNGALSFSGTYTYGTSVVGTIAAGTLDADSTYYLVLEPSFSIVGAIGKPIVYQFSTAEDTSAYVDYGAQGTPFTLQLTAVGGTDGETASIVNDTSKNLGDAGAVERYFNRIQTALDIKGGLSFTYVLAGSGCNGLQLATTVSGKVNIYEDEALSTLAYSIDDADYTATTNPFTFTVLEDELSPGSVYYLAFQGVMNKQGRETTEIVFRFTTAGEAPSGGIDASLLLESMKIAEDTLHSAEIGTQDGQYPQDAINELSAAIAAAYSAYDGGELTTNALVRKAAQTLDAAVESFLEKRIFSIVSVKIEGIPDKVAAGDSGRVTAVVASSPQDDRYGQVRWSASSNITIDANTGAWASTDWGDAWITATSLRDESVYDTVDFIIEEPAADYTFTYTYDSATHTAALSGFSCNNVVPIDVVVPATVEHDGQTYTVTSIPDGNYASAVFGGYGDPKTALVKSITLPSTMERVGGYAFRYLSNCKSIDLGGTKSLGVAVFANCGIESLHIPDSLTSFGGSDFSGVTSLKTITGMKGITDIPSMTFASCSLESIDIPENIKTIGANAFSSCSKLSTITGMEGVTSIGTSAFNGCSSLTEFLIPSGVTALAQSTFQNCSGLQSVTIPASVTSIGAYAFYSCTSLREVIFDTHAANEPVVTVSAFGMCNGVVIRGYDDAAAVRELVSDHSALTANTASGANFLYENRSYEFTYEYDASSLSATLISVRCIDDAIDACEITIPGTVYNSEDGKTYTVTAIGNRAFADSPSAAKIATVQIPASVTRVGDQAFAGLSALTALGFDTTSADKPTFASDSFEGCSDVSVSCYDTADTVLELVKSNSGDTPGANGGVRFSSSSLTKHLPDLEVSAPDQAATGSPLEPVVITEGDYVLVKGQDYEISYSDNVAQGTAHFTARGLGRYDGEVSGTFQIVLYIIGYTFDDGAQTAKVSSFSYGASDPVDVEVPATVSRNGKDYTVTAIADYNYAVGYPFNNAHIRSVELPSTLTSIGMYAFYGCSGLESIDVPECVTTIGASAFFNCSSLKSVTGMEGISSLPNSLFYGCSSLATLDLPDSITSLGTMLFYGCSALKSIEIPEGVTSLTQTFYNCSGIESVKLPDSLTTIGTYAFYGCSALKSIVVPEGVTSVGMYAFYNCTSLEFVQFETQAANIPAFTANAFGNCDGVVVYGHDSADAVKAMVSANSAATKNTATGANFTFASLDAWDISAAQDKSLMASMDEDALIITGSGAMKDFASASDAPWVSEAASIRTVSLPSGLTYIGAYAFADCEALAAIDLSVCDALSGIGTGAFVHADRGLTIYVPNAETAALVKADVNVTARTTALAVTDGGVFGEDTSFEPAVLAEPLVKDGFDFVIWTTDAAAMHPATSWKTISDGVTFYAKFSQHRESGPYPGFQGMDQTVRLLELSALPAEAKNQTDIIFYGEDDQHYDNAITTPYNGNNAIKFAFSLIRGNNANGGDGSYQISYSMPYISIIDEAGNTVASYDDGNGVLKFFDIVFDGKEGAATGYTITAFRFGLEPGALEAGSYTLRFGADIGANNGTSKLGKNVDFAFTVTRPALYELEYDNAGNISGVKVFADEAVDIVIPDGVTAIDADAFKGVGKVASITLPASIEKVGAGAFASMPDLEWVKSLSTSATAPTWDAGVFDGTGDIFLYGHAAAATVKAQADSCSNVTFRCIDDGIYAGDTLLRNGDTIALSASDPDADIRIWKDGQDITSQYKGLITNTNAVSHGSGSDWGMLHAIANGECTLIVRTSSGSEYLSITLKVTGFAQDASTDGTTLVGPQGDGCNISLISVDGSGTAPSITNIGYDETLDYFDNRISTEIDANFAQFSFVIDGPGSAWDISRWDWTDWKTNHLDSFLYLQDAAGNKVATVGNGLTWITLTDANVITLGIDSGIMKPDAVYTFVADKQMTGHNVASALLKDVRWTFTAKGTDINGLSISDIEDQVFDGTAVEPTVSITCAVPEFKIWDPASGSAITTPASERSLVLGKEYTVEYAGNTSIGLASATVKGADSFVGEKKISFAIKTTLGELDIVDLLKLIASAEENMDGINVSADGRDLVSGTKWVTQEDRQAMEDAIERARSFAAISDAPDKDDLLTEIGNLQNSSDSFVASIKTVAVDRSALRSACDSALAACSNVVTAESGENVLANQYWATPAASADFSAAIVKAQGVLADANATQNDIDDAITDLKQATAAYALAKQPGLKPVPSSPGPTYIPDTPASFARYEAGITPAASVATAEAAQPASEKVSQDLNKGASQNQEPLSRAQSSDKSTDSSSDDSIGWIVLAAVLGVLALAELVVLAVFLRKRAIRK